ncbi:hypothetical protein [Streptomyces sp. OE57]|uniref:hypothetical protein n=1 Tax=Streptomyces lacaronensis TaxID=3379885 RepID=UPI0039B76451
MAADYSEGLRASMAIGALAHLTAAGLAWFRVPPRPGSEAPDAEAHAGRYTSPTSYSAPPAKP